MKRICVYCGLALYFYKKIFTSRP